MPSRGKLDREFRERRAGLLARRTQRLIEINSGKMPDFLTGNGHTLDSYWRVAPPPADLVDRRVEITGPPQRKLIINAMNSGANVYMADFEDSLSPKWQNLISGQYNLRHAVRRTITFDDPKSGRYQLNEKCATLMVRPRGWHLVEKHMVVDGSPVSASLFDFGIFFYHNARALVEAGSAPYFYLPKMKNHLEARLWNDVFLMAQDELKIPRGTIRATALIECVLAVFEMREILYELRDHSAGLNCGRWDYLFSFIKTFRFDPRFLFPDRSRLTMNTRFLHSYSVLLIQTCHKYGAHAIGGMAAQVPRRGDPEANEQIFAAVRADKDREVSDGHDGTWVAIPPLVDIARAAFDLKMPTSHQIHRKRPDVEVHAEDLLSIPQGEITEQGLRSGLDVAVQYLEAWLSGNGCVQINNLMEDAATVEIVRSQLWQWVHSPGGMLQDYRKINVEMYQRLLSEEMEQLRSRMGFDRFLRGKFHIAASLLNKFVMERNFYDFMTIPAYEHLD
jgi:malate synthase